MYDCRVLLTKRISYKRQTTLRLPSMVIEVCSHFGSPLLCDKSRPLFPLCCLCVLFEADRSVFGFIGFPQVVLCSGKMSSFGATVIGLSVQALGAWLEGLGNTDCRGVYGINTIGFGNVIAF